MRSAWNRKCDPTSRVKPPSFDDESQAPAAACRLPRPRPSLEAQGQARLTDLAERAGGDQAAHLHRRRSGREIEVDRTWLARGFHLRAHGRCFFGRRRQGLLAEDRLSRLRRQRHPRRMMRRRRRDVEAIDARIAHQRRG